MDNQRKVMIGMLIIGLPLFIWIQFFEIPSKVKQGEAKMKQDPNTHVYENIVKYESLYMGDAANINNLLNELPLSDYKENVELDAENRVLFVDYNVDTTTIEEKAHQSIIYNSTAVFALIENLEEMNMQFKNKTYLVSRDHVEKWFGTTLVDFKDPEVFSEKVQSELSKDISSWFLAYTESE